MTIRWHTVTGAAGYVVQRATKREGPFQTIDNGGGDVLAVPGPSYADTTGQPGVAAWYAVASLASADGAHGELSIPFCAASTTTAGPIDLRI